jgi:glycosyltransferase involved in cell wall biosynthesis
MPTVSVIIKALNEERHIACAIESALATLCGIDGEVILADGGSIDRTVEIARGYPITIVQLNNVADCSCGAGAQLGFQYSSGRFLCLIDGDMRLHDGFLPAAIRFLEENPTVAGVGGIIVQCEITNLEFEQRAKRRDPDHQAGPVTRLHCSGVYRRSAIESIGYLTDRNLHAGEELDLGARLHAQGWTLTRINLLAIDHYGHAGNAYRLLLRRIATRFSLGVGEVVRAAIGRPHFWFVVRNENNPVLCLLVATWWLTILATPFELSGLAAMCTVGALFLFPIATMALKWRSVPHALYSVAAWNVYALSFLPGFLRSRVSPTRWIDSTILKHGSPADRQNVFEADSESRPQSAELHCTLSRPDVSSESRKYLDGVGTGATCRDSNIAR